MNKLKVERRQNQQPVAIPQVRLLNDEVAGYSLAVGVGSDILIVKVSNLIDFLYEQEKPEVDGVNE